MEFIWENRDAKLRVRENPPVGYVSGLHIRMSGDTYGPQGEPPATFWRDFQYHGIGNGLLIYLIECFHVNGVGFRSFDLTKSVAAKYGAGDLILNLNYDTVFEMALEQMVRPFCYAPGKPSDDEMLICKPHGSINLVTNDTGFTFGQPDWWGTPEPQGYSSFSGFMPPRLNKRYSQHPIAHMMLDALTDRHPRHVAMWGIGLTDSDADLIDLYSAWVRRTGSLDVINPATEVADKARALFGRPVRHFKDVAEWNASDSLAG
jgi:hypothetical protein